MKIYKYTVWGLKLAKREPFIHYKTGEVIDDGINRDIILMQNDDKKVVDFFVERLKERIHHRSWKIWVIENQHGI